MTRKEIMILLLGYIPFVWKQAFVKKRGPGLAVTIFFLAQTENS